MAGRVPLRIVAHPIRTLARRRLAAAVIAAALAASACSVSSDQEVAIGADEARKVAAQLPMLDDQAVDDYVTSLGRTIASRTSRADLDWHFRVVNTDVVNAFALPGGYIFVNRGVLERADRMDELAGVLGHEIAHVVLRHSVQQMQKAEKANAGLTVVCMLTHVCGSAAAQVAINVGGSLVFARFGRRAEQQADSAGFLNVERAGIDPRGMETFFEKLLDEEAKMGSQSRVGAWFADHPGTRDRIDAIKAMLAAQPASAREGLVADDAGFRDMKRRLGELPKAPESDSLPGQ